MRISIHNIDQNGVVTWHDYDGGNIRHNTTMPEFIRDITSRIMQQIHPFIRSS